MSQDNKDNKKEDQFVEVAVVTASGSYPDTGFERTPAHQKLAVFLKKAVHALQILGDTADWVATVAERELDTEKTYLELSLTGEVEIDYGPREGGGGDA